MTFQLMGERLIIRELTQADLEFAHRIRVECFGGTDPISATQEWLDWTVRNYRALRSLYQPPYGDYAVVHRASGALVGEVGIVPTVIPWGVLLNAAPEQLPHRVSPEFGLFWATLPEHQRQGYAVESARLVIEYLFNIHHAKQIVATTEFNNLASQRVMQKLGMTLYRNSTGEPFWCEVVGVLLNS